MSYYDLITTKDSGITNGGEGIANKLRALVRLGSINVVITTMKPLDEAGCFQMLGTLIKQRKDSAEQFHEVRAHQGSGP